MVDRITKQLTQPTKTKLIISKISKIIILNPKENEINPIFSIQNLILEDSSKKSRIPIIYPPRKENKIPLTKAFKHPTNTMKNIISVPKSIDNNNNSPKKRE